MEKEPSLEELLKDKRVSHAVHNSCSKATETIIDRATKQENDYLINHIKNLFEEQIEPMYDRISNQKFEEHIEIMKEKEKRITNFWEGLSKTFKYNMGELELYALSTDDETEILLFMGDLCKDYMKKYEDKVGVGSSAMELFGKINNYKESIRNQDKPQS